MKPIWTALVWIVIILVILFIIATIREGGFQGQTYTPTPAPRPTATPIQYYEAPPPTPDPAYAAIRAQAQREAARGPSRRGQQTVVSNVRPKLEAIARQTGVRITSYQERYPRIMLTVTGSTHIAPANFIEAVVRAGLTRDFQQGAMGGGMGAGGRSQYSATYTFDYTG